MDERLEKALAFSKYRASIENRKKAIRRRFETMSVVHINNGMFIADQVTISFVGTLLSQKYDSAVVVDKRSNPILIEDLKSFQDQLISAYFAATNEFETETKKLEKARSVRKAMDW